MAKQDLDQSEPANLGKNRPEDKPRFQKYAQTIKFLKITDIQREFLINRWFDQVDWMSNEAAKNRKWYEVLRSIVIVGSAIVPALVTFGTLAPTSDHNNPQKTSFALPTKTPDIFLPPETILVVQPLNVQPLNQIALASSQSQLSTTTATNSSTTGQGFTPYKASILALVLSQVVAICAAIDQFFKYGDRWRHYRRSVELLKSDGWQFFQLTGLYAAYAKKGGHEAAFALFANQVENIIHSDVEGYISQIAAPKQLSAKDKDDDDPA